MDASRKSAIAGGIVLILLGLIFLAGQMFPELRSWITTFSWPLIIVGAGVLLLIIGLLTGVPGLAVPACIVAGIGGLLYWQNRTGDWASWAYAWALIPGFVGVGTILMGLLSGKGKDVRDGANTVLVSLILFAIFGSFLGAPWRIGQYWPVLLILLGLINLVQYFIRSRRGGHDAA